MKTVKIITIGANSSYGLSGQTEMFRYVKNILNRDKNYKTENIYLPNTTKNLIFIIIYHIAFLVKIILKLSSCTFLFLQASSSIKGVLRDIIISSFFKKERAILHVLGGHYGVLFLNSNFIIKKAIVFLLTKFKNIIVETDFVKEFFKEVPHIYNKIVVIPNCVHIDYSIPIVKTEGIIKLLYLSNMIESKGYWDVLYASMHLKITHNINHEITFIGSFLGDKKNERKFKYFIKNTNWITYKTSSIGIDKQNYFTNSHFFLLPSYYINEGMPLSLIEAMGYGCIPICTNYRGISNIVKDNYNGIIVEKCNYKSISNKISQTIKNQNKIKILQKNAINSYKTKFTLKKFEAEFKKICLVILINS